VKSKQFLENFILIVTQQRNFKHTKLNNFT